MTDKLLRYRCQLLPARVRKRRVLAFTELMKAGWSRELLGHELDGALAWAGSQVLTSGQEKYRRERAPEKAHIGGDDALDAMFRAAGADSADIPTRPGWRVVDLLSRRRP